jgi:hypothetical protein
MYFPAFPSSREQLLVYDAPNACQIQLSAAERGESAFLSDVEQHLEKL